MTRDEAEVLGYLWGHAGRGTEDSNMPEINQSGKLRGAYRHGFRLGESDARQKLCQTTGTYGQYKTIKIMPGTGETVRCWGWLKETDDPETA